jgi:hypothetical protein
VAAPQGRHLAPQRRQEAARQRRTLAAASTRAPSDFGYAFTIRRAAR